MSEATAEGTPAPSASEQPEKETELFRAEALDHHYGHQHHSDLLRITPRWMRWTSQVLIALLAVGLAFLIFARVPEYAHGVAVFRSTGTVTVRAPEDSVVDSVAAYPGLRVAAGDALASLSVPAAGGPAAGGPAAGDPPARLDLTAPIDGVVSGLRIREGDAVHARQELATLAPTAAGGEVLALFPGRQRSNLRPGTILRWRPRHGGDHRRSTLAARIVDVAQAAVHRDQGLHYLDWQGETGALPDSVVLVRARPSGDAASWVDGASGTAKVEIRSERLLFALLPSARSDRSSGDG